MDDDLGKYAKRGKWISIGAGLLIIFESVMLYSCSHKSKFNWEGEIDGIRVVSKDTRKKVCITEYRPTKEINTESFIEYCFNRKNNLLDQTPNEICYGNTKYFFERKCFTQGKNDSLFNFAQERANNLASRVFEEIDKDNQ